MRMVHKALDAATAFFQTDIRYLAKGGFWLTLGNALASLSSFVLVIAFANLVSSTDYGTYQYVMAIISVLVTLTFPGINTAVTRAAARGYDGNLKEGFSTRVRLGILASLASFGIGIYYHLNNNEVLSLAFFIATPFLPLFDSLKIYGAFLAGKKQFKQSTIFSVTTTILQVAVVIGTILVTKNILLIILSYLASATFFRLIFFFYTQKHFVKNQDQEEDAMSYGKHLSFMRMFTDASSQLDRVLLFHHLGAASLVVYTLALAPLTRVTSLVTPVISLAFPKFSERSTTEIRQSLPRKMGYFFLVTVLLAGGYILLAPLFYNIFLPAYAESVVYSQVLALTLLFIPQKLIGSVLTAHAHKRALYSIIFSGTVVRVALLIILIPLLGVWGAIIAYITPLLINGIVAVYYFRKL